MKVCNLWLMLSLLFLGMNFSACGDDDDDYATEDLVGTWKMIHQQGFEIDPESENTDWNGAPEGDDYVFATLIFNSDGSFKDDEGDEGKWSLNGSTLSLKYYYEGELDDEYTLQVLELSFSKSVLEIHIKETEDGDYEYYNKMTFQKQ